MNFRVNWIIWIVNCLEYQNCRLEYLNLDTRTVGFSYCVMNLWQSRSANCHGNIISIMCSIMCRIVHTVCITCMIVMIMIELEIIKISKM